MKNIRYRGLFIAAAVALLALGSLAACRHRTVNENRRMETRSSLPPGPQLGKPGNGPVLDKSGDTVLRDMITELVPKFKVLKYKDAVTGKSLTYNLYEPAVKPGLTYPLVLFMADASTPGREVSLPLTQGYGALVWVTPQWQAVHPCYVLVPQFSGIAVNDAYSRTPEVDMLLRLVRQTAATKSVDTTRLYTTGQSMGGMISMYYDVAHPGYFAAAIFVDSHWDTATFGQLVHNKFVYFIAGNKGKSYRKIKPLEQICRKEGVNYTFAEWSAALPQGRQDSVAAVMLDKGAPVNIFEFEPGSVLPPSDHGVGNEHMYSFDHAFKNKAVREWLFRQLK